MHHHFADGSKIYTVKTYVLLNTSYHIHVLLQIVFPSRPVPEQNLIIWFHLEFSRKCNTTTPKSTIWFHLEFSRKCKSYLENKGLSKTSQFHWHSVSRKLNTQIRTKGKQVSLITGAPSLIKPPFWFSPSSIHHYHNLRLFNHRK
jgi:hypothetical protein